MVDTLAPSHGHIDFPGKDHSEQFQFYFRQHWIRLWRPFRRLIVWTALLIAAAYFTESTFGSDDAANMRHAGLLLICLFFLYAQLSFLAALYKYFLYVIIVTDRKVHRIKKTLLTTDDHQSIDIWMLEDISKNQHGLIQNILGFGTLSLMMQTQDALRIHFTPFIAKKHEMIMRLREQARTKMVPQRMMTPMQKTEEEVL